MVQDQERWYRTRIDDIGLGYMVQDQDTLYRTRIDGIGLGYMVQDQERWYRTRIDDIGLGYMVQDQGTWYRTRLHGIGLGYMVQDQDRWYRNTATARVVLIPGIQLYSRDCSLLSRTIRSTTVQEDQDTWFRTRIDGIKNGYFQITLIRIKSYKTNLRCSGLLIIKVCTNQYSFTLYCIPNIHTPLHNSYI